MMDQHDAFEWVLWGQIGCAAVFVLVVGIAIGLAVAKAIAR